MRELPESRTDFDRFLQEFWRDVGRNEKKAVDEYVSRYPLAEVAIRDECRSAEELAIEASEQGSPDDDGRRIGRYEITGQLARGGQGRLLLGFDPVLERKVVLKTPKGEAFCDPAATLQRLQREARVGSQLYHDGICQVLDVVQEDESLFVVMPYIDGVDLYEVISSAKEGGGGFASCSTSERLWQAYSSLASAEQGASASPGQPGCDAWPPQRPRKNALARPT